MPKKPQQKKFSSEAELCAAFIAALPDDWTPYPETADWDILLVHKKSGTQIGVQAKLDLNAAVIAQALEDGHHWSVETGPDFRAVLVPDLGIPNGFDKIAAYIGFTIVRMKRGGIITQWQKFWPQLPEGTHFYSGHAWHECVTMERHKLPEYVPDSAAGTAAPIKLTEWKIAAIKLAVTLDIRGYLTRADFKHHQVDHRRWITPGNEWLLIQDGHYVRGPAMPDFKGQHPKNYEQITADAKRWMMPEDKLERRLL